MPHLFLAVLILAASPKAPPPKAAPPPAPVVEEDADAPTIIHVPPEQTQLGAEMLLDVQILDASGVFEPVLTWRHAGETQWQPIPLRPGDNNRYKATLPAAQVTRDLEYFIEAYDTKGNGPARLGTPGQPMKVKATNIVAPPPPLAAPAAPPAAPIVLVAGETRGLPVLPIVTIGGGAVLAAVGALLWFGAATDAEVLMTKYPGNTALRPEDQELAAGAGMRGQIGSALMIAGLLAGGGGAAMFFVGPTALQLRIDF